MGIYDRDYIRRPPPQPGSHGRGGLSAIRMWSVNTWLIVICIAVFVIDGFVQPRDVLMAQRIDERVKNIDPDRLVEGPKVRTGAVEYQAPLTLGPQGPIVGRNIYQRMPGLTALLHFSTSRGFIRVEFWRLIGFQFLHAGLGHLLFNMIGLYFFGSMVERHLGSKRYLAFYLLCGIFGALVYCMLNLGGYVVTQAFGSDVRIPGLLFNNPNTPLIGASAGVFGVLMAGAFLAPNAMVLLFFFLPMRLKTLAYALVALALFTVVFRGTNAGGEAGHLGGAIAGFYFIRHPQHLHGFFDILGRIDPTSHHYRSKPRRFGPGRPAAGRAQIDRILEKISVRGLHSLTEKEKRILREASQRKT